jgi:uncharacterized membrane-anchored protein YitT (DUF2179 family)
MTTIIAAPAGATARHSLAEDALALAMGTLVTAFGLYLVKTAGAVTGGTAGLVLLLTRFVPWPFAAIFAAVNVPFAVLAWRRKGPRFVASSVIAVLMLSGFSLLQPRMIALEHVNPVYAVLLGNLAAGIGLLIILRHHSSLGGFNVIALVAQDRLGWRAGWVLLALDATVVVLSAFSADLGTVLLSAAGVAVLNLVLVVNHRPGRYPAAL